MIQTTTKTSTISNISSSRLSAISKTIASGGSGSDKTRSTSTTHPISTGTCIQQKKNKKGNHPISTLSTATSSTRTGTSRHVQAVTLRRKNKLLQHNQKHKKEEFTFDRKDDSNRSTCTRIIKPIPNINNMKTQSAMKTTVTTTIVASNSSNATYKKIKII